MSWFERFLLRFQPLRRAVRRRYGEPFSVLALSRRNGESVVITTKHGEVIEVVTDDIVYGRTKLIIRAPLTTEIVRSELIRKAPVRAGASSKPVKEAHR